MTADRGDGAPDERDADGGAAEERRYRAVLDLDPRAAPALPALLGWLEDPSWRVRRAAAEQLSRAEPALAVPVLVASLASEGGAGLRNAAAAALVQIGPPALPALVEALGAPGADVRVAVVEILGDVGDRRAASAVAALLGDLDSNARAGAAEALGKIGGPEALPALDAALASGDVALRRAALGALGRLRAPPSGARLTALAADRALRRTALRVAATSDDPAALELLAAALADPSRTAREAALAGLGQQRLRGADARRVADAVARAVARAPAAVAAAAAALEDEDLATRAGAVVVLAGSGDARHARALACAAEDERLAALVAEALAALGAGLGDALAPELPSLPPAAHAAALAALARRGDARALRPLVVALASEDLAARVPAVLALAALGTPEAVDALVEALGHRDAEVSGAAAAALAEVVARGGASAARALGAARARVPAPAALRLLGRAGVEGDLELLRAGLRAPHRGARIAAAGALASLAERLPVARPPAPELLDALDDGDAAVRAAAAQAMGALAQVALAAGGAPSSEALRALAAALRDPDAAVRSAVARALGRARAAASAPALEELAVDAAAPGEAAAAALHALSELGLARPEVLARAARHPDAEVVKEAVLAAVAVPGAAASALLLAAAAHARWDVRSAAARAMGERGDRALADPLRRLAAIEGDPLVVEALQAALRRLEAQAQR